MNHWKIFGMVAAVAAIAAILLGPGSASATVLCKKNFKPCTPTTHYTGKIHAVLSGGSFAGFYTTSSEILEICEEATFTGETTNTGAITEPVEGKITALSFGKCESGIKVLELGKFEFHYTKGTNTEGSLKFIETKLTHKSLFGDCVYTAGAGTTVGTFTGGTPAEIVAKATFARSEGVFCPADVTFEALYEITEPASLFIKEV